MKFLDRVRNAHEEFKLNETDDAVIDFIKNNESEIQEISIQKMAEKMYISPNSIMRTAKKLGYSGFAELKFSIETEKKNNEINHPENEILRKIPKSIINTMELLDEETIKEMALSMEKAKKILIAGIGDSSYFGEYFARYLRYVDKKIEHFSQIHEIEYTAKSYNKEDLVFIISSSGTSERLIKLTKNLKNKNIPVFTITGFGKNPLSKASDKQLYFWKEKRILNGYDMTDKTGLIMIIRMLCEEYLKRLCV